MRKEKDFLGAKLIKDDALYGIQSLRANENFSLNSKFSRNWYKAMGFVKLAVYKTYISFSDSIESKYSDKSPVALIEKNKINALLIAAEEITEGKYYDDFIVPALSGGAGTSINMNVNEIVANRALQLLDHKPGSYDIIDPLEHANVFQSTNDTVPTALRIAIMQLLNELEEEINQLRASLEKKERKYRDVLRIAYTQMQEAVPSSWGLFFSAYNDAFSRDWWRITKASERIKVLNIGGSAIGTSMAVPKYFVMNIVNELRALTSLPLARGENLSDATSNQDTLVEAHAILKALAVNLEKLSSDIRLLASDIHGKKLLKIPPRQMGSSIMPGKINPVIPEFVISASHQVYANDNLITQLAGQGVLELNAYLPLMGNAFLSSIEHLIASVRTLRSNCLDDLEIDSAVSVNELMKSPVIATSLLPFIGYNKASELALLIKEKTLDIFEANKEMKVLKDDLLKKILQPGNLLKQGYSLNDLK